MNGGAYEIQRCESCCVFTSNENALVEVVAQHRILEAQCQRLLAEHGDASFISCSILKGLERIVARCRGK